MPLYEFTCNACESEFELLLRSNEKPACPSCSSKKLTKHFSVPAGHIAGSSDLPICNSGDRPAPGTCGAPACGMGGCQFE